MFIQVSKKEVLLKILQNFVHRKTPVPKFIFQ